MTRRKSVCLKWTLVLLIVVVSPFVHSRPQDTTVVIPSTSSVLKDISTENPIRNLTADKDNIKKIEDVTTAATATPNAPRNVKTKSPVLGESIKMVANQLLETPSNSTVETPIVPIVPDTRIPPKLKNQLQKHKIKTRNEDGNEPLENAHPGIAVPVTMEELEKENKISESSTSNEGISTWVLLSNPTNKDNITSTEPTKAEEPQKKQKPSTNSKNKTKRPQANKIGAGKRPIIGSTNKSDLVAGGSAINENVYNKIKDTVLSNVQKNKNTSTLKATTPTTTTTTTSTTEVPTTKKGATKAPSTVVQVKVTSKPSKKKNKNKNKSTTSTPTPIDNESALLPMEPKEQEIELEISTPPTTTKKPKRSSTRKKNKTKKRKTSKPKPAASTAVSEIKTSNKTKSTKNKKPATSLTGPIMSQISNYFSREVMPTVGVGALGLATLVGLAGYFLYPFATPVRRTFEVDKKDDIYRHNAEEYANEGNGQAEEEMLGTVLAGMPAHSKHKLNPYASQTAHISRYPSKKEQDIRYRHVATKYEPNYNVRYPQQKTGLAHGVLYSDSVNYSPHQYETRHVYTTEGKYVYDKGPSAYTPTPMEPIYSAPQTSLQTGSSYGSDASNSVVYGVKPSSDSDFKPVYPFDAQFYSETTNSPLTYPPTSMYLGSNNEADEPKYSEEKNYSEENNSETSAADNKFVVGNVPKELVESATPAVVPEHGPRNLNRKKRMLNRRKRSITTSLEEVLKAAKENNDDFFLSNEIDEALGLPMRNLANIDEATAMKGDDTAMPNPKELMTVYAVSIDPKEEKTTEVYSTAKTEVIESVSTIPVENNRQPQTTTEPDVPNELDTTKRPYDIFSKDFDVQQTTERSSPLIYAKVETTTQLSNKITETTTELKSETTSTMPPSLPPVDVPLSTTFPSESTSKSPVNPDVITYPPPIRLSGFFDMLKSIVDFKYKLVMNVLNTASEKYNEYVRKM